MIIGTRLQARKKTMTVRPSVYEREQDPWVGSSHAWHEWRPDWCLQTTRRGKLQRLPEEP